MTLFVDEVKLDVTNVPYAASIIGLLNEIMDTYEVDERVRERAILESTEINEAIEVTFQFFISFSCDFIFS